MSGNPPIADWKEHEHEGLVHNHQHFHVTHNYSEMTGGFEHLGSSHAHEHDHPPVRHAHAPHLNVEKEHAGEVHIHDHDNPSAAGEGR
jgi:hypothetical protein